MTLARLRIARPWATWWVDTLVSFTYILFVWHVSVNGLLIVNSTPHTHKLHMKYLVLSILAYSLFQVLYKKFATKPNDPAAAMNSVRFLGYLGIHILFWMWPPILILHFTGMEVFEWPPTWTTFGYMILQGLITVVYKISLLFAIALTSPLYSSWVYRVNNSSYAYHAHQGCSQNFRKGLKKTPLRLTTPTFVRYSPLTYKCFEHWVRLQSQLLFRAMILWQ